MADAGDRVHVVILNYNGARFISRCLESLRCQSFRDFSVTVLDNGSTDGSDVLVERHFPEVVLARSPVNLGFAGGNNLALRPLLERGAADYIFTLNNDVVLHERCLEELVRAMDAAPRDVWACQPKLYLDERRAGEPVFNNAGILVWLDGSAFNRGINEVDIGQYDDATDIFGTCAGASLYRASALSQVGLFDERFFAYLEDVDLAWRGRRAGYRALLVPEAVCYHHHGGTAGDPAARIARLERNRCWLLVQDYPLALVLASPLTTLYRLVRLALAAAGGGGGRGARLLAYGGGLKPLGMALAVIKGLASAAMGLPGALRQRRLSMRANELSSLDALGLVRRYRMPLGKALHS